MTTEQLKQKVTQLMDGRKAHEQARIVEITTKEHIRRGLLRGMHPGGVVVISWIPELAENVKDIECLSMDVIRIRCEYKPDEIISLKEI